MCTDDKYLGLEREIRRRYDLPETSSAYLAARQRHPAGKGLRNEAGHLPGHPLPPPPQARRERTIIGFLTGLVLGLGAGASYLILVIESTIPACR